LDRIVPVKSVGSCGIIASLDRRSLRPISLMFTPSISISPSSVTMYPNQTQQFTVAASGVSKPEVSWTSNGGNITDKGLYTAPMKIGAYQITATTLPDSKHKVAAKVNVVKQSSPYAPTPPTNNRALNKLTTASSEFSSEHSARMATDGHSTTRWCARGGGSGEWIKVNLQSSHPITRASVTFEGDGIWRYRIETSTNDSQWTSIVDNTSNTQDSQTYEDSFDSISAQYVRLTVTEPHKGHWASIISFELY